jgi:hypothetical protein
VSQILENRSLEGINMTSNSLRIGGAIVYWSLAEWSKLNTIKDGLLDLGLPKFVPEPRTAPAALKDALGEIYTLPTQLIRPIKAKDGFTVVEEQRGADANGYTTLITAKIDKDFRISIEPYNSTLSGELVTRFNK